MANRLRRLRVEYPRSTRAMLELLRQSAIFSLIGALMLAILSMIVPDELPLPIVLRSAIDVSSVNESGKEYSAIAMLLTSMSTGLFVLVALVAKGMLRPDVRVSFGHQLLLVVFVLASISSIFLGFHARLGIATGMLVKQLEADWITDVIMSQAWALAVATIAALTLIADFLLTSPDPRHQ